MEAGKELDALVAEKVMGLPSAELGGECPDCGSETRIGIDRAWCYGCHEWKYSPYKEYSTDPAAASEVMEYLQRKGWGFSLEFEPLEDSDVAWMASIAEGSIINTRTKDMSRVEAPTWQLAICLAALQAVGVEVEV